MQNCTDSRTPHFSTIPCIRASETCETKTWTFPLIGIAKKFPNPQSWDKYFSKILNLHPLYVFPIKIEVIKCWHVCTRTRQCSCNENAFQNMG